MATMFTLNAQVPFQPPPVGAIPGAVDVSPMGAATYSIPIEVVPGTQGMQPNLSIVYNSMGGMGLLGMKWNLGGLSAITRCGKIPYYDNNLTAIKFNNTDKLAIDGNRLINVNGTYFATGTEYATEIEDFTRIVSYGGTSGHPDYFVAYTDDGSKIEYGNNSSSQQIISSSIILSWYINRITDANGNYMTFNYGRASGEIWISSIYYTGNSGMSTYAKVEFDYTALPDNMGRNTFYTEGYGIAQTKLLKTITVFYGNSEVRKYDFIYNQNDAGERTVHLKEIIMTEYDDKGVAVSLNPTTIEWGDKSSTFVETTLNVTPTSATSNVITGDFNGDGYTDILCWGYPNANEGRWVLYIYNPSTKKYEHKRTAYFDPKGTTLFYAKDINGDGKDELIIGKNIKDNDKKNEYQFKYYAPFYGTTQIISSTNILYFNKITFGDFDGNGTTDIAFICKSGSGNKEEWWLECIKWDPTYGMIAMGDILDIEVAKNYYLQAKVVEANGNGKMDIQLYDYSLNYPRKTFEYNNSTGFNLLHINYPENVSTNYGDVNGDGITDEIVFYKENNIYKWKILFGKGDGSFFTHVIDSDIFEAIYNSSTNTVDLIDINGDGKDDLFQRTYNENTDKTTFTILLSKGVVNGVYKYSKYTTSVSGEYSCNVGSWQGGDFDGDGKLELLLTKNCFTPLKTLSLNLNPDYEFVKEITDGVGKKIQLNYKHKYHRLDSYQNSNYSEHFLRKLFLSVIDNIKVSNGIGGFNTLQSKFYNPIYNISRKTFLGFNRFVNENIQENKRDSVTFSYKVFGNNRGQILVPQGNVSYCGNQKTSQKFCTVLTTILENNRFTLKSDERNEDYLTNTKVEKFNELNNAGRIVSTLTKTFNRYDAPQTSYLLSETSTFTYETITLNGYQKKTVPKTVLSTQQYGSSGLIIADTTTYSYYTDSTNKGRLKSMRQGNIDGSITTTYDYTTKGVCKKKTVSAQGLPSRSETYSYYVNDRFIYEIKNELGHKINFDYNHKTGDKIWEKDANSLETNYKYGVFGQLKQVDYPDGTYTRTNTEGVNDMSMPDVVYFTQIFSTGKPTVEIYYDILGREVGRLDDGSDSQIQYNAKGQVIRTSSPPFWSEYTYDNLGRVIEEKAPYTHLTYSYSNRKTTTYDNLREISSYKDYDALGRITQANDEGGTIDYTYEIVNVGGKKRHKTIVSNNSDNSFTTILSDLWGNRLSITEPNAGTITSEYNKFNELIKQTDANGNITLYSYDQLGRVTSKNYTNDPNSTPYPPTVAYTYDTGNKAIGKLSKIEMGGSIAEEFTYDNLGRLSSHTKHIGGTGKFSYTYNANGQLQTLKYPGGGFAVDYSYTSTGKLKDIRRSSDNSLIYEVKKRNYYNLPTHCIYGNNSRVGTTTKYTYNYYGLVTRIRTTSGMASDPYEPDEPIIGEGIELRGNGVVMDYNYTYNDLGLMTTRADIVVNQQESFTYDKLDRLTKNTYYDYNGNIVNQTFNYAFNGNITKNSQVGDYVYNSTKPHAVKQITDVNENLISENECVVTYNLYNQPKKITEGDYELELSYGANQQRNKAVLKKNDTIINTRYYYNKYYEKEIDSAGRTFYYHYIYGDNGVVALHIANKTFPKDSSDYYELDDGEEPGIYRSFDTIPTDYMYYIHTDHVGSYCAITNEEGQVVQRNSFDPWGNYAFEKLRSYIIIPPRGDTLAGGLSFPITARGFTGHEHYPFFKIINMNGRLYDPVIARFFSPDKYVANSSFTQDFNRYTYCRNNPLMYTDPSGEFLNFVIGAVMGFVNGLSQGAKIANNQGATGWAKFGYMMAAAHIGAGIGAGTAGLGAVLGSAITAGNAAVAGAITGGITGLASGAASGFAMGALGGMKGNDLWNATWKGGVMGMGMGIVSGALMGGYESWRNGGKFWYNKQPSLSEELAMLVKNNKEELLSEIGEAGAKVRLGTEGNVRRTHTGHTVSGGDILNSDGDPVNGFYVQGRKFAKTAEGYVRYRNNKIFISENRVMEMLNGVPDATESIFHEWHHCNQLFSGNADYLVQTYGTQGAIYQMEIMAHQFNYNRFPSIDRLQTINDYESLFKGLIIK